jgi:hypothetical protein
MVVILQQQVNRNTTIKSCSDPGNGIGRGFSATVQHGVL